MRSDNAVLGGREFAFCLVIAQYNQLKHNGELVTDLLHV